MSEKYYYHLTKSDNVKNIRKDGLKLMLGENALSIKETKPKLCLCSRASADAWAIMLDADKMVKITIPDESKLHIVAQDHVADEFSYDDTIPAEYIKSISCIHPSEIILNELRRDYIGALSEFCVLCARYYTEGTGWRDDKELQSEIEESIQITGEIILPVIPRLHYENMPREEKRKILQEYGENGEYTFCDDYAADYIKHPVKRLYQMLIAYPDDQFTNIRRKIYNCIKQNFKYCLRVDTGGWTG